MVAHVLCLCARVAIISPLQRVRGWTGVGFGHTTPHFFLENMVTQIYLLKHAMQAL